MSKLPSQRSLRARLRHETASEHARLDALVSRLDLTCPTGFLAFMTVQARGLDAMKAAGDSVTTEIVDDLRKRVRSDIHSLAGTVPPVPAGTKPFDATAVDYIVLGSRLGTAVLRKRWLTATDARVRATDAYFKAPSALPQWKSFCDRIDRTPAIGKAADRTVRDAAAIFDLYAEIARDVLAAPALP